MTTVGGWAVRRYSPWTDLAGRPHLQLELRPCEDPEEWGYLLPDAGVIVIDPRRSREERRCTLAHELAHVDRGDRGHDPASPDAARQAARDERAADQLAARRLISLDDLARELRIDQNWSRIAADLDVDVPTLYARLRGLTDSERQTVWQDLDQWEGQQPWSTTCYIAPTP